jgi:CO dehydrogenase/acetyl-CoA synthase beta subunit
VFISEVKSVYNFDLLNSEYNLKEQSDNVVKEEKTEDTKKTETAPEEAKEVETKVKEDYTEMTVKELKAEDSICPTAI